MKKKFKIITIAVIILILSILTIFCSKINKISLIKNIKHKVVKVEEIQTANEVTTIDVTDLEDNGKLEHEHIFKTMYDENKHWEECTICTEKRNQNSHSYTQTWASGFPSCESGNYYTNLCQCGYSYKGYRPCVWDGKSYANDQYRHFKKCSFCKESFCSHGYYLYSYGNGKIYYEPGNAVCTVNGKEITCSTGGTCSTCKYKWNSGQHSPTFSDDNKIVCLKCGKNYGGFFQEFKRDNNVPGTYTMISKYKLTNGATYIDNCVDTNDQYNIWPGIFKSVKRKVTEKISETEFTVTTTLQFKDTYKIPVTNYYYITKAYIDETEDGVRNGKIIGIKEKITQPISPDFIKPEILIVEMENEELLTNWSRTKPIIISGTENYCETVKVKILDDKGEIVFEGGGNVSNNNYEVRCIPEVECDTKGKIFTVIVTDSCENSTSKEFSISKVDIIPPKPTSNDDVGGDWAKSKDFTFTATDYGIGEVQVAFNDIKDLKLANVNENIYSRDYKFTGDVYQPKQLSVMYKDALGNISMQKITIDKIDNTAPTITNAEIHNSIITITSNDEHEKLGEGSGVVKYRYLASEEKLENPELTTENSIEVLKDEEIKIKEIYKKKYVYAVAEDYVGNISEVYEFKVPELKLIATVNQNTSNGKGEVILDWSSYDVTDKYFVIYRKRENQEEWETIVSLAQKLTGNTYTDILANDEAKPSTPNITITGDAENNNINITATTTDNGSKYTYYIEAYDSTEKLLSKSN